MARLACVDKDGTLVVDEPYNVDPHRIRPVPGAAAALRVLAAAGFGIAVVTNQSGIARGRFDAAALLGVRAWVERFFDAAGIELAGFYACPHLSGCACRKPQPGLVTVALAAARADAGASWMIGDILDDVEAGSRAGCRTALVDTGTETEWRHGPHRSPSLVAGSLLEAAQAIAGGSS